jgi:cytochrome c556
MRLIKSTVVSLVCASVLSLPALAADPNEVAIGARQGYMKMVVFNAKPLFGMAKGKVDYDADLASALADNLLQLSQMNTARMWPKGSDGDEYLESNALPEIWADGSDFKKREQAFKDAVAELATAAGDGQSNLRAKVAGLGKSCKACHDDYRAE